MSTEMTPDQENIALVHSLIWILVHKLGGRVVIKDAEMQDITLQHSVVCFSDPANRQTVLTSTIDKPANAN